MENIEIYYSKKLLYPFMGVMVIAFIGMNSLALFTDYFSGSHFIWKLVTVATSFYVLYTVYKLWNRLKDNKPYIVLTDTALIYQKKI